VDQEATGVGQGGASGLLVIICRFEVDADSLIEQDSSKGWRT
jgi:hypothetical protein